MDKDDYTEYHHTKDAKRFQHSVPTQSAGKRKTNYVLAYSALPFS